MKFIKKYGVIVAFVLVFLFGFNDVGVYAYADTDIYPGDYETYLNVSGVVSTLSRTALKDYGLQNNALHLNQNNAASIDLTYYSNYNFLENFYNNYNYYLLSNCAFFNQGNTYGDYSGSIDLSGWNTIIMNETSSLTKYLVLRVKPQGNICLVNNIIYSDEPLEVYVGEVSYYNNSWHQVNIAQNPNWPRVVNVDNTDSSYNNYYVFNTSNQIMSLNIGPTIAFTDLDIYFPHDDYYDFSYANFDFDSVGDYFNFNFLKTGGVIENPNDVPPITLNETAISNLMFRDSTFYACSSFKHILHYNRFVFNEYQLTNPENFVLKMNYQIIYKDDYMNDPVTLFYRPPGINDNGYTYDLQLYLGYLTRFGNPSCLDLSSLHFRDSNGYTLDHYIRQTMSSITSIDPDYANSDSILNNPIDNILSGIGNQIGQWVFGAESNNTYKGINQLYQSHLQTFKIYGFVEIAYKDNPLYISGQYSDSFDFISDSFNVESTSNQLNNYPSDQQSNLPVPSGDSSGGSNITTGGGSIAYGGNVTINQVVQRIMEPFALDTVTVAGVGDNWNYMIRAIQDDSDNGFWAVLEKTYKVIPDEIWGWLIAAVSAILGCAVFRFYITAIRG